MSALIRSLKLVISPPHRAGRPFLAGAALATFGGIVLGRRFRWLTVSGASFAAFCLYFFRDPERFPPERPGAVLAPADGHIVSILRLPPPPELDLGSEPRWRVAIFLSVLDVHVNRMPVAATVTRIAYHAGQFLNASVDKASELNERNAIALQLADGRDMAVVQIAGLVARRILCEAREGDSFTAGERFGIIRFGSRTDLYLPPGVEPVVSVGQTMIGGETVIAQL